MAQMYMRSLQQAVKSEDLVVAQEDFEIHSKLSRCEILIQSAVLIVFGSFVSTTLHNINIFTIIRHPAYLRGFDVDLEAVAEKLDVYKSVDSWGTLAIV